MIRAVLDANVFVSAVLSPRGNPAKILTGWRTGQFHLVISGAILEEIDRVLRYPKIVARHRWPEEHIRLFVEDLAHLAILTRGKRKLNVIAEEPADNRYLECAEEGEATYIVSGGRHLLRLGTYRRIRILTRRRSWKLLDFHSADEVSALMDLAPLTMGRAEPFAAPQPYSIQGT